MPQKFAEYILTGIRTCKACGIAKPISNFCRKWRREDPLTDQRKNKCRACRGTTRARLRLHDDLIDKLGGRCDCCGETLREFLTVDHIGNTGAEHRRKHGSGRRTLAAIKREGAPREKYRVLCQSCNSSLGHHGYCPHNPAVRYPVMRRGKTILKQKAVIGLTPIPPSESED